MTALMVGPRLEVFALPLALMVLEVIIPNWSTPPLRVMLTGWRARLRRTGRYVQIMVILFRWVKIKSKTKKITKNKFHAKI